MIKLRALLCNNLLLFNSCNSINSENYHEISKHELTKEKVLQSRISVITYYALLVNNLFKRTIKWVNDILLGHVIYVVHFTSKLNILYDYVWKSSVLFVVHNYTTPETFYCGFYKIHKFTNSISI